MKISVFQSQPLHSRLRSASGIGSPWLNPDPIADLPMPIQSLEKSESVMLELDSWLAAIDQLLKPIVLKVR